MAPLLTLGHDSCRANKIWSSEVLPDADRMPTWASLPEALPPRAPAPTRALDTAPCATPGPDAVVSPPCLPTSLPAPTNTTPTLLPRRTPSSRSATPTTPIPIPIPVPRPIPRPGPIPVDSRDRGRLDDCRMMLLPNGARPNVTSAPPRRIERRCSPPLLDGRPPSPAPTRPPTRPPPTPRTRDSE